jgi:hypothetical protein
MRKPRIPSWGLLAALPLIVLPAQAFALSWGLSAAPAKAFGEWSDGVRVGVAGGLDVFYPLTPHLRLGLGAGYTYFPLESEDAEFIATGSADILEVMPQVEVRTTRPQGPNAFGRLGLGYASAHTTLRTPPAGPISGPEVEVSGRENVLGLLIGAGGVFGAGGTRFELAPAFHVAFTEGRAVQWVALVAVLRFGG